MKIPITFLKKGQELNLVATTRIGKGSEHARFSPGLMFYRNIVDIKIDKDCPKDVVDVCPQKILKSEKRPTLQMFIWIIIIFNVRV